MQIITFVNRTAGKQSAPRVGALLDDDHLIDFAVSIGAGLGGGEDRQSGLLRWFDLDGPLLQDAKRVFAEITHNGKASAEHLLLERSEVELLAPVPRPGKLMCIGLNYRDHAVESKMEIPKRPVVFSKFSSSVIAPDAAVVVPDTSEQVDYEAELAVVIGRRAKHVKAAQALDYVLGYTCFNDVSARDFQFTDGQWQRGKSCDTFAPMGPSIITTDEIPDPHVLSIKLVLNGKTMQDSNTNQLIFRVPELIEFLSETITLEPGDVIATGTPPGVGFARKPPVFLKAGDVMQVEIEGLGVLRSPVSAAETSSAKLAHSNS